MLSNEIKIVQKSYKKVYSREKNYFIRPKNRVNFCREFLFRITSITSTDIRINNTYFGNLHVAGVANVHKVGMLCRMLLTVPVTKK